jgi:hypothetical protein
MANNRMYIGNKSTGKYVLIAKVGFASGRWFIIEGAEDLLEEVIEDDILGACGKKSEESDAVLFYETDDIAKEFYENGKRLL